MIYVYERNGRRIERDFPLGSAPRTYRGYTRICMPAVVHFKGRGFTKALPPEQKSDDL